MKIEPFRLERYFANYEFSAPYLLCCSDCESLGVKDLLVMEPQARQRLDDLWLGYTESKGNPELRNQIASLYQNISSEQILVHSGAEEVIFTFMNAALTPGEHIIVHYPCYQSLAQVALSAGCQVTHWETSPANGWELDLDFLADAIRPETRAIVINCPHNPTGYLLSRVKLDAIIAIARQHNLILFSDEVYRGLEYSPLDALPAVCELYEHGVSLGVMSKSFGLAGLRIGWIATQDGELYNKMAGFKDYTTICNSAPSELLASIAIRNSDWIIQRNRQIIQTNLSLLNDFFRRHSDRFEWQSPKAGPIAFPSLTGGQDAGAFAEQLVAASGVLLLPGSNYDPVFKSHFRIGFGRKNMPECLALLDR
ncbi:MAG TPA: aminotransferase class I/II-fold pyridoxal phosphate-dependent enzyme [Anaerolineaceae bacterium]|nr:aminotransferase class I/II-fold pyridoxal phosphate-dependent enzyme [Anaerolineaceae bacterium]